MYSINKSRFLKVSLTFFLLNFSFLSFGQPYTLKREIDLDTLRISIQLPGASEAGMQEELKIRFEAAITEFNARPEKEFYVVSDTAAKTNWMAINMSPINYVTAKRNITGLLLNAGIIGGHVILISSIGWTFLPILPLLPHTISSTQVEVDPQIISDKRNFRRIGIGSIGMFNRTERQTEKFKKAFGKQILQTAYQLERQDRKNRKRRARNA